MLDVRKARTRSENLSADGCVMRNLAAGFLELHASAFVPTGGGKCERLPLEVDLTVIGVIGTSGSFSVT